MNVYVLTAVKLWLVTFALAAALYSAAIVHVCVFECVLLCVCVCVCCFHVSVQHQKSTHRLFCRPHFCHLQVFDCFAPAFF